MLAMKEQLCPAEKKSSQIVSIVKWLLKHFFWNLRLIASQKWKAAMMSIQDRTHSVVSGEFLSSLLPLLQNKTALEGLC